jgi:hypothetical protein
MQLLILTHNFRPSQMRERPTEIGRATVLWQNGIRKSRSRSRFFHTSRPASSLRGGATEELELLPTACR